MAILRTILLAAAVVLAAACQREPTGIELTGRRIAVHSVLVAGSDSVTVFVSRAGVVHHVVTWHEVALEPVTGASVLLIAAGDTVRLADARACLGSALGTGSDARRRGCYTAALAGGVVAGRSYDLVVSVPGAEPVRGSVRVPETHALLAPAAHTELFYNRTFDPANPPTSVTARWQANAAGDLHTELRMATERNDCAATLTQPGGAWGTLWVEATGHESATISVWNVDCATPASERTAGRLVVTRYDEHYTQHLRQLRRNQSVPLDEAGSGVSGGIGVFGAASTVSVPVVLIRR